MASGILITAVLIFAVRGMFLGFNGVIARLLGLVLGYSAAVMYRAPVAAFISEKINSGMPSLLIEILTGFGLFIGTVLLCNILVNSTLTMLANIIPGLKSITHKESIGSKITGAGVNGALAAAIVLMGIWAVDKATNTTPKDDQLHQIASRFGDSVFSVVSENTDLTIQSFSNVSSSFNSYTRQSTSIISSTPTNNTLSTGKGTATITSSKDPSKTVSIENIREIFKSQNDSAADTLRSNSSINSGAPTTLTSGIDSQALLSNPQLQQLLQDPKAREMALEQLQNNPEQLQQLLNQPQLKKMLEQFSQQ
ncbi:MAG: hypothetical protein WCY88_17055 [Spongiibacteraceae bacterium]